MKVEIKEASKEMEYPCLMIDKKDGMIILLKNKTEGILLHKGEYDGLRWKVGDEVNGMDAYNFTPFEGSITLSND